MLVLDVTREEVSSLFIDYEKKIYGILLAMLQPTPLNCQSMAKISSKKTVALVQIECSVFDDVLITICFRKQRHQAILASLH